MAAGAPIELEAHLQRLASSAVALFGQDAPREARELALARARGLELGRMRLDVAPGDDGRLGVELKVAVVDPALVFPPWERGVTLVAVAVAGGIGAHKWADRRLIERAEADCAPALPLLLDADGAVLEVSRGNVFLLRDGVLVTPAADGRLLPGVARRRLAEVAAEHGLELREQIVSGDDLVEAQEVFVTGSVRGVEPVRACAGGRDWEPGTVTPLLSSALRSRWLDRVSTLAP